MATTTALPRKKIQSRNKVSQDIPDVPQRTRELFLYAISLFSLLTGFFFNSPKEILDGLLRIQLSPSVLLSDFMEIGNIGAAFVNSALMMLLYTRVAKRSGTLVSGPLMASLLTIGGFAFFGKNLYNSIPIVTGVFLHAKYRKEPFGKFILPAFFGTAVGPIVSQISFGFVLPHTGSMILGIAAGLFAGFILPPLASQFIRFHQGYSLYNMGFTGGIVGMLFMSIMRAFALENNREVLLLKESSPYLMVYLLLLFSAMVLFGVSHDRNWPKRLLHLFKKPGQLVSDFTASDGFSVTVLNMGLLGFLSLGYLYLAGGTLNGPVFGGIFTVVGFGAFGKHVKNVIPVMAGVYLSNFVFHWEVSSISSLLAALFATNLAPIAGTYGILPGLLAGFIHMAVVMNVGDLHGGMNLYNNGFSGGFVAAILVPILDALNINKCTWEEDL